MQLELRRYRVSDVRFGSTTCLKDNILYLDKAALRASLMEDANIREVDFDIARPGEAVRIMPVKDIVQPRCKAEGPGDTFPGFIGGLDVVGEGATNVLSNCCVPTCGKIVNFQEGIIDMSGPAAEYNSYSKMFNVVPLVQPVDGLDKHSHEAAVRLAGIKTAYHMACATKGHPAQETETFLVESLPEMFRLYPDLPKVAYVCLIQTQGLMHDTYVYGLNAKGMLSTVISPLEVLDGAIVSGNCAAPCHKTATINHQDNPVIMELLRRHGKELCFLGVILNNESALLADKIRGANWSCRIARQLGADAVIVTEEGGGNPETDLMLNCRNMETAGIKTVLVTDEYAGRDGRSPGLADTTPEANAVITTGNGNQLLKLPPMDRVIGDIDAIKVTVGGSSTAVSPDGSILVEIAAIMGCMCELGYERMTTRLK